MNVYYRGMVATEKNAIDLAGFSLKAECEVVRIYDHYGYIIRPYNKVKYQPICSADTYTSEGEAWLAVVGELNYHRL